MLCSAGPGRLLLEIVGPSLIDRSSADFGGGAPIPIDSEEWSKAVAEGARIVGEVPRWPVSAYERGGKREQLDYPAQTSAIPEDDYLNWREDIDEGVPVLRDLLANEGRIEKVYFAYRAYMEWRDLIGKATENQTVMDVRYLIVKWRDITAARLTDGSIVPLGNRTLGYKKGRFTLQSPEGDVYLFHDSVSLPVVFKTTAQGDEIELHHVPSNRVVAEIKL